MSVSDLCVTTDFVADAQSLNCFIYLLLSNIL